MTPLDLSDGGIDAGADAAVQSAFGSIPGVSGVRVHHSRTKDAVPTHVVRVHASCWAPSLHEADLQIGHRTTTALKDPAIGDELLEAFASAIGRQKRRAEAGLRHGIARPLPLTLVKRRVGGALVQPVIEMRHMHVDAALPVLAADNGLVDLPGVLREGVMRLLDAGDHSAEPHDGDDLVVGEADVIVWNAGTMAVGTRVALRSEPGRSIHYDGTTVSIQGRPLAETMLAGAAGRPLRDIVQLHPAIDARIVRNAQAETVRGVDVIHVALEPRWAPWSTIERGAPA
jgi:hypothetical protein